MLMQLANRVEQKTIRLVMQCWKTLKQNAMKVKMSC